MTSGEDSNAAQARLVESLLHVESELEGSIQRFQQKSDSSIESKSVEAGVWPAAESISSLTFLINFMLIDGCFR